jgi:hypothetical protein
VQGDKGGEGKEYRSYHARTDFDARYQLNLNIRVGLLSSQVSRYHVTQLTLSIVMMIGKGNRIMIEGKGLGGKKIHRVNVSLTNKLSVKLNRLATACNMKPTTLAGLLIKKSLDNAKLVAQLQNEYCTEKAYKVVVVNNGGELNYVLSGREDIR